MSLLLHETSQEKESRRRKLGDLRHLSMLRVPSTPLGMTMAYPYLSHLLPVA